ncbi:MAG: Hsp70 family protein [Oscillospiraceae bacterium]|nr:Hsp70 family protein [Oscillospiraceae bacterium]
MKVSIGLDFGHNYTYIGFVHGVDSSGQKQVQSLVATRYATRGIPTLYWNNGKTELFGADAQRRFKNHPQFGVECIKAKLLEQRLMLGDKEYTPSDIVQRMLTRFLEDAAAMLRESYALSPDVLEVVMTVPVDFDQAQVRVLRSALESVKLSDGTTVEVKSVVQEPVASAVRYLDKHGKADDYLLVFDLGGGTLDVALVKHEPNGDVPFRVIDQDGDRELGGRRWDEVMAGLLGRAFREQMGKPTSAALRRRLKTYAVDAKEQLSEAERVSLEIENEGNYIELSITREQFEEASLDLAEYAVSVIRRITERQKDKKIGSLILTGGGSYMPQIEASIRAAHILPKDTRIRCFHPERAIAEGAAILADAAAQTEKLPGLANIAPHGYGIVETVSQRSDEPLLRIFIRKNDPLPASADGASVMGNLPEERRRRSIYGIYETDVLKESSDPYEKGCYAVIGGIPYTAIYQGREVLTAILTRPSPVPAGTPVKETLTLNESLQLSFEAEDTVNNAGIRRQINIENRRS